MASAPKKVENTTSVTILRPRDVTIALTHMAIKKRPVFLWGGPGLGKSAIAKQVSTALGFDFVDIRLSQMEPTDLRGIPYPAKDEKGNDCVLWSPPHFYQRDPNIKTLYFFDEMNAAPQSIQAAAYQIILDRKIGDYELGPNDVVFAAGNRETDKGSTFKMPTPLMNRFTHLEIRAHFEDWQNYAMLKGFAAPVVAFLTTQEHMLYDFNPATASRAFATPRSWDFASQIVEGNADLPDSVMTALLAGTIGDAAAVQFMAFLQMNQALPAPMDILKGKFKELKSDQRKSDIMYALTISLCYKLRETYIEAQEAQRRGSEKEMDEWVGYSDTFLRFMMDNFKPEMTILGARNILHNFKLKFQPKKMKHFAEFTRNFNTLILEKEG
jgi:MoxR-like ATPase